jgi:hypothetical protein
MLMGVTLLLGRDRATEVRDVWPSLPLLVLPIPHYTPVDAWTSLPEDRREPARDYLRAERLTHRFIVNRTLLARVEGWRAEQVPRAYPDPAGLRVTCSCHRRQPCAHIGALVIAYAEEPDRFRRLAARPGDAAEAMLAWAGGDEFPWDEMEQRAADALTLGPEEAVNRARPDARVDALLTWATEAAPELVLQDAVQSAWLKTLSEVVRPPVPPSVARAFFDLLGSAPELALGPVLAAVRPVRAAEPVLLAQLFQYEAESLAGPRPSLHLAAQTVVLLYADWLAACDRAAEVRSLADRFSVLDPARIRLGDWLYTHGRHQDAWRLWESVIPKNPEQARLRQERLSLAAPSDAPPDQTQR